MRLATDAPTQRPTLTRSALVRGHRRAAMLGITSVLIANTVPGSIPVPIQFPDTQAFVLPF